MDVLSQLVAATRMGRPRSFVVECQPPWARRYSAVPGAGLHLILEGSVCLVSPGGAITSLAVGDVLLLPAGSDHVLADDPAREVSDLVDDSSGQYDDGVVVIGPDGPRSPGPRSVMLCGVYFFDQGRRHPLLGRLPDVLHLPARLGRQGDLGVTVSLLAGELSARRPGSDAAVSSLLDLLFIQILRTWHEEHPDAAWSTALADAFVGKALSTMHDQPEKSWTVADLADLVGLSRAAFAKRFKHLVGQSPVTYLTWWRLTVAGQLLRSTDLLLAQIADRIGYATEYAFAAAFKREYGVTPGAYRRNSAL